jgi:hypothetical protein
MGRRSCTWSSSKLCTGASNQYYFGTTFTGTLEGMGFKLNPYNPCIANLMMHGKQCTIAWSIDDNKIAHVDCRVVTKIIEKIEEHFKKMTVT